MRPALFAIVCWVFPLACAAALTDAEKQLLLGSISKAEATEYGRNADAAGLERIIRLEDEGLVHAFNYGMQLARIDLLPPQVEALVVAHFDHPKVGAASRAVTPRYRTRELFDLHYARLEAAYRSNEPSFTQILRTDQAGIEEPLLRLAHKFPSSPDGNPVMLFLGQRKHAAAVPLLIASLATSRRALTLLLGYPSVEVWHQASAEIEKLHRQGALGDAAYAAHRRQLDPYLDAPDRYLQAMRSREAFAAYTRQRDAIVPGAAQIAPLKETDPRQYAAMYAEYAARLEPIAARLDDERVSAGVGGEYYRLGMFVRFRLRDPAGAAAALAKSAGYRHMPGQIALADLYQFELRNKEAAIRAYQTALDEARATKVDGYEPYGPPGSRMNAWWTAWLAQEIEYLRTGQPFGGRIPEAVIGGFFEAMNANALLVAEYFARDVPAIGAPAGPQWPGRPLVTDWGQLERVLAVTDRAGLARKLENLPPSRLALMATLAQASALQDPQAILGYLERNDPSGYWSACLLGTVAHYESKGAPGRNAALATGTAQLLPGMADAANPNPLRTAAERFLGARGLRVGARP